MSSQNEKSQVGTGSCLSNKLTMAYPHRSMPVWKVTEWEEPWCSCFSSYHKRVPGLWKDIIKISKKTNPLNANKHYNAFFFLRPEYVEHTIKYANIFSFESQRICHMLW